MGKKINFEPQGLNILVKIPSKAFDGQGDIIINDATKEELRRAHIESGKALDVVVAGDSVEFATVGSSILVTGRALMQKIELDGHKEPFWLMREGDVAGKFTK